MSQKYFIESVGISDSQILTSSLTRLKKYSGKEKEGEAEIKRQLNNKGKLTKLRIDYHVLHGFLTPKFLLSPQMVPQTPSCLWKVQLWPWANSSNQISGLPMRIMHHFLLYFGNLNSSLLEFFGGSPHYIGLLLDLSQNSVLTLEIQPNGQSLADVPPAIAHLTSQLILHVPIMPMIVYTCYKHIVQYQVIFLGLG